MARKKQTYEEQRMDELLYAEEYRRRLRMEREAKNSEAMSNMTPEADIEDDDELELIRRDRDERKKRNDDIISKVSKIYTVPADVSEAAAPYCGGKNAALDIEGDIEPNPHISAWTPIVKESESGGEQDALRIEIGESVVTHTLHIEGIKIEGVNANYTAAPAEPPVSDIDYVGIERRKRDGSVLHTNESFSKYAYPAEEDSASPTEKTTPVPTEERTDVQADIGEGVIFSESYADSAALDDMQSFIYAPVTKAGHIVNKDVAETAYTDNGAIYGNNGSVILTEPEPDEHPYIPDSKGGIGDGTEEDDLLSFLKYTESRNRELANGQKSSSDDIHNTHTTRETVADAYSEAEINGKSRMNEKDDREHKRAGSATERREVEADMERFLREDAEYKKNADNKKQSGLISDKPTVHPFDRNALKKEEKVQCERDIAFIEARINSRLDELELEKDTAELTFTENTGADRRESSKRDKDIKDTKKKLRDAVYFERADNKRYYSFVMMDLIHENLPKNADLKLLISLREKLISLLHQRDTVNKRLTELYLGESGGKKSATRLRDRAARKAMRDEFNRQKRLNNRIKSAHLEKSFADMLRELMDKQVLLAGELAECRHILRHERPKGQAAKDVKARERRADAEYKKNKREIERISKTAFKKARNRKHKNNSAALGWIGLLAIVIIGVVVWLNWDALLQYIGEMLPGFIGRLIPTE